MAVPKLSICIATYNRADFIGKTLDSITPQLTNEVELVVVDGASTDKTQEIVEAYVSSGSNVRYVRLPKKGGVDQDYCKSVELADGEYVWLFTDDDLFEPKAIQRVLEEIKVGYNVLIVNARVFDTNLSDVLAPGMLEDCSDKAFSTNELDGLFEAIVPYISFIGCVVINKKLWLERDKEKYFGTEFVHVGQLFQAPIPGTVKVLGEPLINIRYGNAQWTSRASIIWLSKWPSLLLSFTNISEELRRKKTNLVSWGELKKMIVYRALNSYSFDTFRKAIVITPSPLWWKCCALVVAIVPSVILKVVVAWYLKTFRWHVKEARMTLLDLSKV